jgi:hypothetical protein
MDYYRALGVKKQSKYDRFTSFFKWQWDIMQKEIKDYHS